MKSEGFIIYEHINGIRVTHFRKRTARTFVVAVARVHDLVRSQKWTGQREFSIWNALTPIQKIIVRKEENRVEWSQKAYLQPAVVVKITTHHGLKAFEDNERGYEKDYSEATKYRRTSSYGGRAGDLTSWIKSDKREKPEPKNFIDKRNYQLSEKVIHRNLGR
jgi:hypothetical protein